MTTGWEGILQEGEEIRWQGRPDGRFLIVPRLIPVSIFGLFFFAFAVFWITLSGALSGGGLFGFVFPLFGQPFALIGLHLLVGTHLWNAIQRRGSFYTLTDRRAFFARDLPVFGRVLQQVELAPDVTTLTERGGLTDVQVGQRQLRTRHDSNATLTEPFIFEAVPDVAALMTELTRIMEQQDR